MRPRWPLILAALGALALGAAGWLATAAVAHVRADHARLHDLGAKVDQLWDLEIRRAQAAAVAGQTTTAPAPGGPGK